MKKIGIVVPCFNESLRFDRDSFLSFVQKSKDEIFFCFVNDGSTDNTSYILKEMTLKSDRFYFLDLKHNKGKAEAVRQGVFFLSRMDEFEWIGFWDADLATPLNEIELFKYMISKNSELKFVMGSRIMRLGSTIYRHWYRHYLGRVFATCASISLSLPVYDTQCGAKFIYWDLAKEIFCDPFKSSWLFDIELIFRTIKTNFYKSSGNKIFYEIPLNQWQDKKGSKLKFIDFLRAPLEMVRIYFAYRS